MPKTLSVDAETAALNDLLIAIQNPAPMSPFAIIDNEKLLALETLTTIFQTPEEPNHDQSTDEPVPIPVRPAPPNFRGWAHPLKHMQAHHTQT